MSIVIRRQTHISPAWSLWAAVSGGLYAARRLARAPVTVTILEGEGAATAGFGVLVERGRRPRGLDHGSQQHDVEGPRRPGLDLIMADR